jgi:hypothetical protein
VKGQFDRAGQARVTVPVRNESPLEIELDLDLTEETAQVTGWVWRDDWSACLLGDRAVFHAKNNPCPFAGNHTVVFPAAAGTGYAVVKVSATGRVSLVGALPDGARLKKFSVVAPNGEWPLCVPLYRGAGLLMGWMHFNHPEGDAPRGNVVWIRSSDEASQDTLSMEAWGSPFEPPTREQPSLLDYREATLVLSSADGVDLVELLLEVDERNRITYLGEGKLNLSIQTRSGLIRGTWKAPDGSAPVKINGVLLQKPGLGLGYFLGSEHAGAFRFGPRTR